jgi:hypothetical protein
MASLLLTHCQLFAHCASLVHTLSIDKELVWGQEDCFNALMKELISSKLNLWFNKNTASAPAFHNKHQS